MFRIVASNGPGGVSVVTGTAEAALRKVTEFRAEGFRWVSVLDARGKTIEEIALCAMADTTTPDAAINPGPPSP
jgi:hypothetical protein